MKVTLMEPYMEARGLFARRSEYYIRMMNGRAIVQRKPNRKGHIATEREKKNQERFAKQYAVRTEERCRNVKDGRVMVAESSGR